MTLLTKHLFFCAWVTGVAYSAQPFDPLQYVDPLIGASNGGNVFPGASLPYGMAKAVADTNSGSNQGGFTLDGSPIIGFSMMHDSGTGGSPSLGNFPLFPYATCNGSDINGCNYPKKERGYFGKFSNDSVKARPGYFGVTLSSGIQAEMTAAMRAALFKFSFPSGSKPLILQDLSDLSDSRQDNATVAIDADSNRITGSGKFKPSFGAGEYVLYFCTDFKGAEVAQNGIFVNSRASSEVKSITVSRSINNYPLPGGAFVQFANGDSPVYARVATSFISVAQACSNAEQDIPTWDFDGLVNTAAELWRQKLAPIVVNTEGVNQSFVTNFYSGVYRTMINPQNYTGENFLWSSTEPYFDSFYCLWDQFRSQLPLLTIVDPAAISQMVRSLIDTYRHVGWLPDCRMTFCKGHTQGGSNADNVLADAYLKGLKDGIDWEAGYAAVVKDAEVEPFDWSSQGRGGLDSWKALGYIPVQDFDYKGFGTMTRSISRTLEYAYNDFCIAQMADGMGKSSDKAKYLERSGNWQNIYKSDQVSTWWNGSETGFTGFFQPKWLNQTWGYQNPLNCSNLDDFSSCSLQNTGRETFESSIWEYG
jgi:predicted alpha-1,2-mannosidase